jgi:flagellar basal-body rod protein FlgB
VKKMMDVTALRHSAIASNLANVSTPGYKRVDLSKSFEDELKSQIKSRDTDAVSAAVPRTEMDSLTPSTRADGNNVQIDKELLALSTNTMNYDALTNFASGSRGSRGTRGSGRARAAGWRGWTDRDPLPVVAQREGSLRGRVRNLEVVARIANGAFGVACVAHHRPRRRRLVTARRDRKAREPGSDHGEYANVVPHVVCLAEPLRCLTRRIRKRSIRVIEGVAPSSGRELRAKISC